MVRVNIYSYPAPDARARLYTLPFHAGQSNKDYGGSFSTSAHY